MYISGWCLLCYLFKWNSTLLALPESNLLIFKVADVKPYCLLGSSGFQSQMIRGFIWPRGFPMPAVSGGDLPLTPLCACCVPPADIPWWSLSPVCISALPTLFSVSSSLYLATFCQSSSCILGYLHWYGCYLIVSVGQYDLMILLVYHLSRKSIVYICCTYFVKFISKYFMFSDAYYLFCFTVFCGQYIEIYFLFIALVSWGLAEFISFS